MTREELMERLHNDTYEWSEETHNGRDGLVVRCTCPRCQPHQEATHIAYDALDDLSWPTIRKHIINGHHVVHVTRVVGYYSRVDNWNKSKQGELKDRHNGDYRVRTDMPPEQRVA